MIGGDLSNEPPHRLLVVFEGLIGTLTDRADRGRTRDLRLHRWRSAAHRWQLLTPVHDAVMAVPMPVELITYLHPREAHELGRRATAEDWPFTTVTPTDPRTVSRLMQHRRDILRIVDPDDRRWAMYPAGRAVIASPAVLARCLEEG